MGLLRKLFGGRRPNGHEPDIRFGRYSDAYKADFKYDAWDKSLDLFEDGDYDQSFDQFFIYLTDEEQENVSTRRDEKGLHFELLQGSKLISGVIGDKLIHAEAKVAKATELSIGFLRRLMELNYNMKYGRYALDDDDNLTLIFDSYLLDGSPYKMYYALKEIAVSADKQDDLLVKEFSTLVPVNTGHLKDIPEAQKKVKIAYLRKEINKALDFIDKGKFNSEQFAGGISYLMLEMAYRLDYLIKPEGELTETLERIHRIYFAKDNKTHSEKNVAVRKEFQKILDTPDEDIGAELYLVSSSFGITSPGTHEQLRTFIDAEIKHMDWYVENRHERMALAFPAYIVGYSLFNYAYQPPVRDLFHLYYRITEPEYFAELGFTPALSQPGKSGLDKRQIMYALEDWREKHIAKYPNLRVDARALNFSSLVNFSRSYIRFIRDLDMTKASR